MKIKPDHYATMKAAIAAIWSPEKHKAHETFVTNEGWSKDVAKRVRWDWSYYANLTPFIWDTVYAYANDDHVDTALRQIIRELQGE